MSRDDPMPHSVEAEQNLLGLLYVRPHRIARIRPILAPSDCYFTAHAALLRAMLAIDARGEMPDEVTVFEEVSAAEWEDIEHVAPLGMLQYREPDTPSGWAEDADLTYARIIKEKAALRGVICAGQRAGTRAMLPGADAAAILAGAQEELGALITGHATGVDSPLRPRTLAEMRARPKLTHLIDRVLPAGLTSLVYGPSGDGKTALLEDMACPVALGWDWQGRKVRQGSVAILAAEGGAGIMGRIDAWIAEHHVEGGDIPNLYVIPYAAHLRDDRQVAELIASLRALPVPLVWLIVDTVSMTSAGYEENSNSDMAAYLGRLAPLSEPIGDQPGAHRTYVHHTPYADSGKPRGASALEGNVDTRIAVTRAGNTSTVRCWKQRDGWMPFAPFTFTCEQIALPTYDGLIFGVLKPLSTDAAAVAAVDDTPLSPKRQHALDALREAPGGLGWMDWYRASGMGKTSFGETVKDLQERKLVDRSDAGTYICMLAGPGGPVRSGFGPAGLAEGGPVRSGVSLDTGPPDHQPDWTTSKAEMWRPWVELRADELGRTMPPQRAWAQAIRENEARLAGKRGAA